ncbi:MAG: Na+/H+ antiporter subunit E, partial [Pseudomonadota bacterium]
MLKLSGRRLIFLIALIGLWFLLSGYFTKATLVAFGALSIGVTMWFAARAGTVDREGVPTSVFPRIFSYMTWLFLEIGKANVVVAREVLKPKMNLAPKLFRVPATQPSDLTRTIFANSVTLT